MTEQALPASAAAPVRTVRRIQPSHGWLGFGLRDLWRSRELLYFLVWRDTKVRYRQTFLGGAWALFRPLVSMILFTVVFGHLVGVKSGSGVPYALFVFAGLLPWLYFASALSGGSSSVVGNVNLVTKTYFPRLLMPLAAVTAPVVDFLLGFVVFLGLFAWYGRWPSWHIVFAPLFLLLAVLTSFGLGLWLAGITVRWRDVTFAVPFLTQLWMYVTPVIYPVTLIPPGWRWVIAANPMTGVVEGFRWSAVGGVPLHWSVLGISVAVAVGLTLTGLVYFRRVERGFADLI